MALVCQHDHDYLICFETDSGDRWYYHFDACQVDQVLRRVRHNQAAGHFTESDMQRLLFAIEDVIAVEKLTRAEDSDPPTAIDSILRRVIDNVKSYLCGGK